MAYPDLVASILADIKKLLQNLFVINQASVPRFLLLKRPPTIKNKEYKPYTFYFQIKAWGLHTRS